MKRRLPATRRGEVVLALIIVPPLNADAIRRAPAPPRNAGELLASSLADRGHGANRAARVGGVIARQDSSTASAANLAPSCGAQAASRLALGQRRIDNLRASTTRQHRPAGSE